MRRLLVYSILLATAFFMPCIGHAQVSDFGELSAQELLDFIDENPGVGRARLEFSRREFERRRDASAGFNARQALATGSLTDEEIEDCLLYTSPSPRDRG